MFMMKNDNHIDKKEMLIKRYGDGDYTKETETRHDTNNGDGDDSIK